MLKNGSIGDTGKSAARAPIHYGRPGHILGSLNLPYGALLDGQGRFLPVEQLRLAPGQVWCLPVVQDDGSLRFAPWRAGDPLANNRFGIPEPAVDPASTLAPAALSLALVPLLGWDRDGHRLGMGGGYYDRTLANWHSKGKPLPMGYAHDCQQVPSLPCEHWDVPLPAIITPSRVWEF